MYAKFLLFSFKGIFSSSCRLCGTAGRIFANPIIPQPLIGLQLTHNQSINQSPKASLVFVGRLPKFLDDYYWVSSPQLITKVLNLRKEKKRGIFSSSCRLYGTARRIFGNPIFSPNLQMGFNSHTINQSPKNSLLLSAGYLKSCLISTEFIITT